MFVDIVIIDMVSAKKKSLCEVLCNLFTDLCGRLSPLFFSLLITIISLLLLIIYGADIHSIGDCTINKLFSANISILSIDIAALSILFALFNKESLEQNAKEAFKEQSITFIGNALVQYFAITFAVIYFCCGSSCSILLYVVLAFQIWPLLHVFEMILQLHTMISAILNK